MQQGNDTGRADQVFAALEAVTLGGISARMRSDSVFENARQVWGAALNRLNRQAPAVSIRPRGTPVLAS